MRMFKDMSIVLKLLIIFIDSLTQLRTNRYGYFM